MVYHLYQHFTAVDGKRHESRFCFCKQCTLGIAAWANLAGSSGKKLGSVAPFWSDNLQIVLMSANIGIYFMLVEQAGKLFCKFKCIFLFPPLYNG